MGRSIASGDLNGALDFGNHPLTTRRLKIRRKLAPSRQAAKEKLGYVELIFLCGLATWRENFFPEQLT
jgi:hypothetical protein